MAECCPHISGKVIRSGGDERRGLEFLGARGTLLAKLGPGQPGWSNGTRIELYRCLTCGRILSICWVPCWVGALGVWLHRSRLEILAESGHIDAAGQRDLDYSIAHDPAPFRPWIQPSRWRNKETAAAAQAENVRHGYSPEGRR